MVDGTQGTDGPISQQSMQRAVKLMGWIKHETRRVYARLAESEDQRKDRELVERIQKNGGKINPREMQRGSREWPTADSAEGDLERLQGRGLREWEVNPPAGKGGRPGGGCSI